MLQKQFSEIIELIKNARSIAIKSVNKGLINLYWNVGEYIHKRVESSEWGPSVVKELAEYIKKDEPDLKGFSDKNLWRMKQFFEVYKDFPKLSAVLRETSWTNNLIILSRAKTIEEKEFYLSLCITEKYSSRELERQISTSLFERTKIGNTKVSAVLRELHPQAESSFKGSYPLSRSLSPTMVADIKCNYQIKNY